MKPNILTSFKQILNSSYRGSVNGECLYCGETNEIAYFAAQRYKARELSKVAKRLTFRVFFRLSAFWIGVHYSENFKRYCINPFFCFTICIIRKDGIIPYKDDK